METQSVNILAMAHLVVLALWGGVVATEAVVEVYPFRCRELHPAAIRFHFWIDLLVELPLVLAVIATGVTLATTISQTPYPPDFVITDFPFTPTYWTIRVRDAFGSTIFAPPLAIYGYEPTPARRTLRRAIPDP